MDYKRVTKKQSKIARHRAHNILNELHKVLKNNYIFSIKLVGSAAWGTIIEDQNGEYDLDYQILLTKKSKEYKENGFNNPTKIKQDFLTAFNKIKANGEVFQSSTTAITLINKNGKPYHVDFVIIKTVPDNNLIIRRNNKKETPSYNEYTWNELPKFNEAYDTFKSLMPKEKQDLIENYVIPRKYKEKQKQEGDSSKVSSSQAFIEEVNNYIEDELKGRWD